MTIVIAVLATAFVAAVVIGVAAVLVIRQRKIKAEEHFEMELISREEKIRDASSIIPSAIMIGYLSICSYLSYFLPKNVIHVMIIQWMIYIANRTHYPFKSIMFHLVDLWILVSMTLICFIQVLYHNCFYFVTSLTWVLCL
jgi:hypothetical protein